MRARTKYPNWFRISVICLAVVLIGINLAFPPPLKGAKQVSSVVNDHNNQWLTGFAVNDGTWRIKADLKQVDPRFVDRLIAIEDSRFYTHSGIDLPAIARALKSWKRRGRIVSGASTITMQLVRQIEPRPRTFKSKFLEMGRALQYELLLSKDEILELYLTHISYGGNIEGIVAASWAYFGKAPDQLTDSEIALLIALPQAPEARRPDRNQGAAEKGRNIILDKLAANGSMDAQLVVEAKEVPVLSNRFAIPELAWISAHSLKQPNQSVQSTIDYKLQADIENLTSEVVEPLDQPVNIAVTIVENATMNVRAHIGSADRQRPGGWIDMTDRHRSPGSTLKPLIYGLAMDEGLVAAGSKVEDAPTRFGNYQPENFNRRYYGDVRVHEALQHSLNVPAIAVLDQLGSTRLESTLQGLDLEIAQLGSSGNSSGLAIGLGGVGMTVNDLAVIYAALANDGIAQTLNWYTETEPRSRRMVTSETARNLTRILRQAPTPKGRVPAWLVENAPPIAYKTGTSYGFRDAWAAGYTDEWTVIVWVGRPDGAPRKGQTGRIAAAPLLFDVFSTLPHRGSSFTYIRNKDAPSGLLELGQSADKGPQILFPPDESEILAEKLGAKARGFALSARAESNDVTFYVAGQPIAVEQGKHIWRPDSPGFYDITAIDADGRSSQVSVEVVSIDQMADARF